MGASELQIQYAFTSSPKLSKRTTPLPRSATRPSFQNFSTATIVSLRFALAVLTECLEPIHQAVKPATDTTSTPR